MRVGPSVNEVQLVDLIPNTEYTLTAYVLFGDITSDPLTTQEVTCMDILIFCFVVIASATFNFLFISCKSFFIFSFCLENQLFHVLCIF